MHERAKDTKNPRLTFRTASFDYRRCIFLNYYFKDIHHSLSFFFNLFTNLPMTIFCWIALGCSGCFSGSAMVVVLGVRHAAAEPRCSRPSGCTVGYLLVFPTWLLRRQRRTHETCVPRYDTSTPIGRKQPHWLISPNHDPTFKSSLPPSQSIHIYI